MPKSLLYHTFGIRGYEYQRTDFEEGCVFFTIRQPREKLCCSACGSQRVFARGQVPREFRWLLLKNPENLDQTRHEPKRLREALKLNESLAAAYYLKEELRELWNQQQNQNHETPSLRLYSQRSQIAEFRHWQTRRHPVPVGAVAPSRPADESRYRAATEDGPYSSTGFRKTHFLAACSISTRNPAQQTPTIGESTGRDVS